MEGTVKWFNSRKGYGFIQGEDGNDYFVHYTAVPKGAFLRENDKVSFDPADGDRGKQAQNVKLLGKASEEPADGQADEQSEEQTDEPAEEQTEEKAE